MPRRKKGATEAPFARTNTKKKTSPKKPKKLKASGATSGTISKPIFSKEILSGNVASYLYLGMDPGRNGATCLIDSNKRILFLRDNPKTGGKFCPKKFYTSMCDYISYAKENNKKIIVCIEDPTFSPVWARRTIYAFGIYYGMGLGILNSFVDTIRDIIKPSPKMWQSIYLQDKERTSKEKSMASAYNIFNNIPLDLDQGEDRGDRAESLLLANYVLEQLKEQLNA